MALASKALNPLRLCQWHPVWRGSLGWLLAELLGTKLRAGAIQSWPLWASASVGGLLGSQLPNSFHRVGVVF